MDRRLPFGELLRHHRLAAGLTHEQLAEKSALSARAVSDLERGVSRRPRRETVALLGEALKLSPVERTAFEQAAWSPAATAIGRIARGPGSSPVHLTSFVGRDEEIGAAVNLFRHRGARLLTLTGPGGTGKSRLATYVAAALAPAFPGGVRYVELAPLAASSDSASVIEAIARAFGAARPHGATQLEDVVQAVPDSELLLVVDNFEHLLPTAPLLTDLLRACPKLSVLATSRASLRLSGEHELPVSPLAVPRTRQPLPEQQIGAYASVRLFVDRAQQVRPDFALTKENASDIGAICERLDGLPLALELAAARIKLLGPRLLLQRLDAATRGSAMRLLTGGASDTPRRHRTLRETMLWSYNLLNPEEQRLFRCLAIFAGGCTLAAAEAVCTTSTEAAPTTEAGSPDVLDGLASLVDKSLVFVADGPDGEPRFRLLETVRELGLEQLRAHGDLEDVTREHARYYLELVKATGALLFASSSDTRRSAAEYHNLEAALRWLLHHG
jgi:predicted ATPase/transcriptional regulator with XRE-family HTH domain